MTSTTKEPKRLGPKMMIVFGILLTILIVEGIIVSTMITAFNEWDGIGFFLSFVGITLALLTRRTKSDYAWLVGMILSIAGLLIVAFVPMTG